MVYRYVTICRDRETKLVIERRMDEHGKFTLVQTDHELTKKAVIDFLNTVQPEQFSITESILCSTDPKEITIYYGVKESVLEIEEGYHDSPSS